MMAPLPLLTARQLTSPGYSPDCVPPNISFIFLPISLILSFIRLRRVFLKWGNRSAPKFLLSISVFAMLFWIFQDIPVEYLECAVSCSFKGAMIEKLDIMSYHAANYLNFLLMFLKFRALIGETKMLLAPHSKLLLRIFATLVAIHGVLLSMTVFLFLSVDIYEDELGVEKCKFLIPLVGSISLLAIDFLITSIGVYLFLVPLILALKARYDWANLKVLPTTENDPAVQASPAGMVGVTQPQHFCLVREELFLVIVWNFFGVLLGQSASYALTVYFSFTHNTRSMEAVGPFLNVLAISIMFQDHHYLKCGTFNWFKAKRENYLRASSEPVAHIHVRPAAENSDDVVSCVNIGPKMTVS